MSHKIIPWLNSSFCSKIIFSRAGTAQFMHKWTVYRWAPRCSFAVVLAYRQPRAQCWVRHRRDILVFLPSSPSPSHLSLSPLNENPVHNLRQSYWIYGFTQVSLKAFETQKVNLMHHFFVSVPLSTVNITQAKAFHGKSAAVPKWYSISLKVQEQRFNLSSPISFLPMRDNPSWPFPSISSFSLDP